MGRNSAGLLLRLPERKYWAGVFLLALATRAAFLWHWNSAGYPETFGYDPYVSIASWWLGLGPPTPDMMHSPGYAWLLWLLFAAIGSGSVLAAQCLNVLLGSGSCLLVGLWARSHLAGSKAREEAELGARLLGLWVALDPALVAFSVQPQSETLFILLQTLFFLALVRNRHATAAGAWALGALGGLASLTRSVFVFYLPALFLVLLCRAPAAHASSYAPSGRSASGLDRAPRKAGTWALWVWILLGWISPILPWTARNYARYGAFIPLSAQSGWNLYEGFTLDRDELRRRPYAMGEEAARLGIRDPVAASRHFQDKALRFMRERPLESLRIIAGKALRFWRPWPYDPYSPRNRAALGTYSLLLFVLALAGLWSRRGRWIDDLPILALFASLTLAHSVFFTSLRYRLPLEPFLCFFAAMGVLSILKSRLFKSVDNRKAWLLAVLALGAVLRLAGIHWGLPALFNADEPHHVNIAVSFGRGSLDPQIFKYPTLWMYTLFGTYGCYFLAWSGAGLAHSLREFGQLFAWRPEGFYLLGRLLAAAFSLGAVLSVWRSGRLIGSSRTGLCAAALLAVSPNLVLSAHAAKPESLMLLLAACAWHLALKYLKDGRGRDLVGCGLASGLAISTQYTAAPLALLAPCAWSALRAEGRAAPQRPSEAALPRDNARSAADAGALASALIATAAGFFAASPFILLDWPSFWSDVRDMAEMASAGRPAGTEALWNLLRFAGHGSVLGPVLAAGALAVLRRRPWAALLALPAAANVLPLMLSSEGSWPRYLFASYPALALLAAAGTETACRWTESRCGALLGRPRPNDPPRRHFLAITLGRSARIALLLALVAPGAWESLRFDRGLFLPDTRHLAAGWISRNIPEGARVLADQEHNSPPLRPSRTFVRRLLEQARGAGHPRQRLYELMLEAHPGGGYEVLRVLHEASDLHVGQRHLSWSAQGRMQLDVSAGLEAALEAGVEVAVLTDDAPPGSGLGRFYEETVREGRLLAEFRPEPGRVAGPRLRLYELKAHPRRSR